MTAPETLELKSVGAHVLLVTLNRPEASNAFNTQMAWDLVELFERLSVSANGTRVVVLTGAGDKAFCAGGDLKERKGMTDEAWQAQHLVYERMIRAVITCPLPVIGAINGAAYGGDVNSPPRWILSMFLKRPVLRKLKYGSELSRARVVRRHWRGRWASGGPKN